MLQISQDNIRDILENLRLHALEKLQRNKRFQQDGIATLHIQVVKSKQDQESASNSITDNYNFQIDIRLSDSGQVLRKR